MTRPVQNRRKQQSPVALFVVISASLALHAAFALSAEFHMRGDFQDRDFSDNESEALVSFAYSCTADAHLALLARQLSCTFPGLHSNNCHAKNWQDYTFDLLLCEGLEESKDIDSEEVVFLKKEEIDALKPEALADVSPIDELEAAKLLEIEIEKKSESAQKTVSSPVAKGQIIEVLKPQVEMTPDSARFVSEYDTKVEKETVARGSTEEMISNPALKELPVMEDPPPLPKEPAIASTAVSKAGESAVKKTSSELGMGNTPKRAPLLAMRETQFQASKSEGTQSGADALEANGLAAEKLGDSSSNQTGQQANEGQEALEAGSGASGGVPNLRPTQDMVARALGGGSVDKLDGVASGENTALNSKKWKYASFFNRTKRQVAQNWHPAEIYQQRDPTGRVYGISNRETLLEVYLKPDGALDRVVVLRSSGVDFLDDEAAAAFQRAQPFPNPPSGLLEGGSQRIRFSFGFHFQVGSQRDSWKVFRHQ